MADPWRLFRYGVEFCRAADLAIKDQAGRDPKNAEQGIVLFIPAYYLVCHALELVLKAFLVERGVTIKDLREHYGHDLLKCLDEAIVRGLTDHTPVDHVRLRSAVEVINKAYESKSLEYSQGDGIELPDMKVLYGGTRSIVEGVYPVCYHGTPDRKFLWP